jgi:hypothetical protein
VFPVRYEYHVYIKSKAIPVTGLAGLCSCEPLRSSDCLDIRLTDGGAVVSLTRRPSSTPRNNFWCSFLLEAE